MSTTKKQYDREFKVMAVELSKSRSDLSVLSKELELRLQQLPVKTWLCTKHPMQKNHEDTLR